MQVMDKGYDAQFEPTMAAVLSVEGEGENKVRVISGGKKRK